MKLKKTRLISLVPIFTLGIGASILIADRATIRNGNGNAWFGHDVAQSAESWWYDIKMKYRAPRKFAPVTVAAIDDASIERFGRWPWNRGVFAELIDLLYDEGARSVVFDVVFSEPEYKSRELEKTLQVPVPGRETSIQQILKLSNNQVSELSKLLPEIGDQYLGQSVWAHADKTVLGYFWRSPQECKIHSTAELGDDSALALGLLPKSTWYNQVELILKNGYRLASSQDFLTTKFGPASIGPLQLCPTINRGAVGALSKRQGFFNAQPDGDGIFRRSVALLPLMMNTSTLLEWGLSTSQEGLYLFPSLSLSAVMAENGIETLAPIWRDYAKLQMKSLKLSGGRDLGEIPLQNDGSFLIDFANRGGGRDMIPTLSLARAGYWSEAERILIRDKIIMIGPTSTGVFDLRPNPVDSQAAGIYLHAAATSQLIELLQSSGAYFGIQFASASIQIFVLWIFLIALAVSLLYFRRALVTGIWWPAILLLGLADFLLFRAGWASDFILVSMTWSLSLGLVTLLLYLLEERERIYLKNAFARYVSPEIVRRIEENPSELSLDGERKELSILFSDIRGFTSVSESLEPEELRVLLNAYFKPMTESIQREGGTVDKFMGDAIMALFGAPLTLTAHAGSAVRAAESMIMELQQLHREDSRFSKHNLQMGIAISSGFASVGNMGTDKIFNYTALGDVVNVASRLEGLTKHYEVPLLISDSTFELLSSEERARWRLVDRIRVSGKSKDVVIYDLPTSHVNESRLATIREDYASALSKYTSGQWQDAKSAFAALAQDDAVSRRMLRRCELALKDGTSSDWDGVWNFDHK